MKNQDQWSYAHSIILQLLTQLSIVNKHAFGLNSPSLQDTPRRIWSMLLEMTAGYREDAREILSTKFKDECEEMVILRKVPFASLCEHHLLPFTGTVDIGYLPTGYIVGLSKLARVVDCFSRRLQVQERMTSQIAESIMFHLEPIGVGVVVRGFHSCMACRGVQKPGEMITSSMLGVFRTEVAARNEFLHLCDSTR